MTNAERSWRDVLRIHPAAELLPLMTDQELRELSDDIRANGLHEDVALVDGMLLDGRNRLDALEMAGVTLVIGGGKLNWGNIPHRNVEGQDPVRFVISKNFRRRHLTTEQKQELIAKVLKLAPERSNRQIADSLSVDHKTVASVRAKKQSTGEIPQLTETIGKDGKPRRRPTIGRAMRTISEPHINDQDQDASESNFSDLVSAWQRASSADRARFLNFIRVEFANHESQGLARTDGAA